MEFLSLLINKFKVKELMATLFLASLITTFLPKNVLEFLSLYDFKTKYNSYISISLIVLSSYYIYKIIKSLFRIIMGMIFSKKRIAIKYFKNITEDEMRLLREAFYNPKTCKFSTSGEINWSDGRKIMLEKNYIIYPGSRLALYGNVFSYNLQPYIADMLNNSIGNTTH